MSGRTFFRYFTIVALATIFVVGIQHVINELLPKVRCGTEMLDTGIACTQNEGHSGPHINKNGYVWQQEQCTAQFMETGAVCSAARGHKGDHHCTSGGQNLKWIQTVPGTVQNVRQVD